MNIIILFACAGLFVTIGDLVLAQWARNGNWILLVMGLSFNIVGITFYANILKLESVGLATAIFLGINIVAVTLCGYFFLNQSLTFRELTGLLLLTFAVIIIEI